MERHIFELEALVSDILRLFPYRFAGYRFFAELGDPFRH